MAEQEGAFVGTGWAFPPSFPSGGDQVEMVSGEEDIRQSLEILLSTRMGERIMREDFGSSLDHYLFEEIDQGLLNDIRAAVSDALIFHEPRIMLEAVEISGSQETNGLLLISITYSIRTTNSRYNLVYPYYLQEATNV